jgi:hypothetical protein
MVDEVLARREVKRWLVVAISKIFAGHRSDHSGAKSIDQTTEIRVFIVLICRDGPSEARSVYDWNQRVQ